MLMKVFSVRDMKAEAFLQPFFCPTQGSALRAFGDACVKPDSPFYLHPNDYVLYEIGTYDDSNGFLKSVSPVSMMACAADFVADKVSANYVEPAAAAGRQPAAAHASENGVK